MTDITTNEQNDNDAEEVFTRGEILAAAAAAAGPFTGDADAWVESVKAVIPVIVANRSSLAEAIGAGGETADAFISCTIVAVVDYKVGGQYPKGEIWFLSRHKTDEQMPEYRLEAISTNILGSPANDMIYTAAVANVGKPVVIGKKKYQLDQGRASRAVVELKARRYGNDELVPTADLVRSLTTPAMNVNRSGGIAFPDKGGVVVASIVPEWVTGTPSGVAPAASAPVAAAPVQAAPVQPVPVPQPGDVNGQWPYDTPAAVSQTNTNATKGGVFASADEVIFRAQNELGMSRDEVIGVATGLMNSQAINSDPKSRTQAELTVIWDACVDRAMAGASA